MDNPKLIRLAGDFELRVGTEIVTCRTPEHTALELTRGQQKLLGKLADNLNNAVSMAELYEAYTGEAPLIDAKGVADNLAKMKNTLPKPIRSSVKSVRGFGYRLVGTVVKEAASRDNTGAAEKNMGRLSDLAGDFYGFYLDPLGTSTVLAAYIHIENKGTRTAPELKAYAMLGIRSENVLMSEELYRVFHQSERGYRDAFRSFKKSLTDNNRRCSWGEGTVKAEDNLAMIALNTGETGGKWIIMLDVAGYMHCGRDRDCERDGYRGGLGLVLSSRTLHGTYCSRFGVVRREFIHADLILNHEEMKDKLKILDDSKDAFWKPLKLSTWQDKLWYDWFMND